MTTSSDLPGVPLSKPARARAVRSATLRFCALGAFVVAYHRFAVPWVSGQCCRLASGEAGSVDSWSAYFLVVVASNLVFLAAAMAFATPIWGRSRGDLLRPFAVRPRPLFVGGGALLLAAVAGCAWIEAIADPARDGIGFDRIAAGVAMVISVGIVEEFLFRVVLFGGVARAWGFWKSAIAAGAVFVGMHYATVWASSPPLFLAFSALGMSIAIVFSGIYILDRRGLWSIAAFHAILDLPIVFAVDPRRALPSTGHLASTALVIAAIATWSGFRFARWRRVAAAWRRIQG
jgi:membrane protease YdiL (CAAX protease family)